MQKKMPTVALYFRTVFYTKEELLSAADFQALQKHILARLPAKGYLFTPELNLPLISFIKPLNYTQVVFQLKDLPEDTQREALAVLLTKFPFLSLKLLENIITGQDSYINITYTKYQAVYKVTISLERLGKFLEREQQDEEQQERLAQNRRLEKKYFPGAKLRRLRAKPLKLLRDYQVLELVEKENF